MSTFAQRLTLRFAALVTATTAAVLAVGCWLLERQVVRSAEALHEVEFVELRNLLGNDPHLSAAEIHRRIQRDADNDTALYFIQVHSDRGDILFRSPNLGNNVLPDLSGRELHWTIDLPNIGPVRVSEFHDGSLHLQIATALTPLRRLLRDYVQISAFLVLGVGVISLALGYAFSRVTLKPVRAIAATANRIRSDNLSERIPLPAGRDELASLTLLLNQMFERLEAAFDQVRRVTADASHELKTPLALVRLNAEKLRPRLATDPDALATLEDLLEEITRLHQIIDSLLFLSRAESGILELHTRTIDVPAFVHDVAEDATALALDRHVRFVATDVAPGTLRGEPTLLRQLILNLVTNALAVSPPHATITLAVHRTDSAFQFTLTDEGPGLRPEQLARIFDRFVRFDLAPNAPRTAEAPAPHPRGHGLGLAICRSIATLHGGTIRAENRSDRSGLRVLLDLPIGSRPPPT